MRIGKGSCHGTFGELVQGIIDEKHFLITFPIPNLKSEAVFIPNPRASEMTMGDPKVKALKAGKILMQQFDLPLGGSLDIRSNIPSGKGMASSSADIVAAIRAIADSYSLPITKEMISSIAAQVEPTDGVMYDEVVAYDYIHGELIEGFGTLPSFHLVGFDFGGEVDTVQFNHIEKEYKQQDHAIFIQAYELIREGFGRRDFSLISKATTLSARVNQKILPKPFFYEFEKLAQDYQGGIVVAHSGTVMGILLDGNLPNQNEVISDLSRQMSDIVKNPILTLF
ncbi:GHMP family kinase ATP-binding protein [Bacillus salipaludis]|uniref:Kinase n=1 Tax=Bacillus salipaludis TaxID=2547811 RepID=A0AA90TSZ6_9BACI|nr:kinase [Bacillus salipaludis]MDQ6598665.1 kinase [Bacillus salipaludis]